MRLCICIDVYRLFWTKWPQWPIFNLLFESLWKVMRASERKYKNCCLFCIQEFNTIHCILWLWRLTRYNMVSLLIFTYHHRSNFLSNHSIISCFNPKFIDYHIRTRWFWKKIVHFFHKKMLTVILLKIERFE